MTTARVIRGTRAKIFVYFCAILIITGLIACYNNTLSQLDDARKSNDICHQQEENLSTQLQVISDYKQRLEKSLKTEKAEHQQTKLNLENKLNEERSKNDKSFGDAKLKFDSLQQHFNLLQTEYDDYKEECSKTQQKQQEEVNDLQAKLEELKEELKKVKASKESLKTQYLEVSVQKENLEKQIKENQINNIDNDSNINHLTKQNHELKRELEEVKEKCSLQDTLQEPKLSPEVSSPRTSNKISSVSPAGQQIKNPNFKQLESANLDQNVLHQPIDNGKMSSKSTTKSGLHSSVGSLNGARPLLVPTVTPETARNKMVVLGVQVGEKIPKGVVAPQHKKDDHLDQEEVVNNRYRNVKESANDHKGDKADKDIDKENGAHEQFDVPQNGFDGLQLGDSDHIKHAEKQTLEKKHIDTLGVEKERKNYDQDQADYKDLQNDVQLEENEEDDDLDGYEDRLARHKDTPVRD